MACLSVEITITLFLVFVLFLSFLPGEGCRDVRGNPGRLLSLHRNVSIYIQCSCCKSRFFFVQMIKKKDSGATVLHLTLSEKRGPLLGNDCIQYTFFFKLRPSLCDEAGVFLYLCTMRKLITEAQKKAKKREYNRKYYQEHKEAIKESQKKYISNCSEEVLERQREAQRKWADENREYRREYVRRWRKKAE